ncbi:MAG: hypothetical protein ACYDEP_02430 [Acidimicrobiales bacterium]
MNIFAAATTGTGGGANLAGGWQTINNAIQSALGSGTTNLITLAGTLLVIVGVLGWLWERRKGGGSQGHQKLFWTIILGAVLAGPGLLIPIFLTLADFIVNAVANLLQGGGA